eukprot:174007-Prymnesium_polylepis.1
MTRAAHGQLHPHVAVADVRPLVLQRRERGQQHAELKASAPPLFEGVGRALVCELHLAFARGSDQSGGRVQPRASAHAWAE